MPVTFTPLAAASASTANQSTAYNGNAGTPLAGDLLVAFVVVSGNLDVGTFSGGGLTWTKYGFETSNSSSTSLASVWWAAATTATSVTPSYLPFSAATGCAISCVRVRGTVNQTNLPLALQQTSDITSNFTAAAPNPIYNFQVSSVLSNNGVLLFASNNTNSNTQWTPPTGFTEISEVAFNTPANSLSTAFRTSGATGTAFQWTNANSTNWIMMGLEFAEQIVVGTSFDPMGMMGIYGL